MTTRLSSRFAELNPLKLLPVGEKVSYERLPGYDSANGSPFGTPILKKYRWRSPSPGSDRFTFPRLSLSRIIILTITAILGIGLLVTGGYRRHLVHEANNKPAERELFFWEEHFPRINGFFNGVRLLVPYSEYVPEQKSIKDFLDKKMGKKMPRIAAQPTLDPVPFNPYPDFDSYDYLRDHHPVKKCFLDEAEALSAPDIYVYPGLPQNMSDPFFGSYGELGISDSVCYDRFGRLGPYGYGYDITQGGLGIGDNTEKEGSDKIWSMASKIDYRKVDWGKAQRTCYEKNQKRFSESDGKKAVKRSAYVLRTYQGYEYTPHQMATIRAMINELSLKSGGEYDVHLLVQIRDNGIPIWASDDLYNKTLRDNVPEEFWGMATLWSEQQMRMYYPEPFPDNVINHSGHPIHSVYRTGHFALQWFAQEHPEYDFYWNWEMDIRYTGHYYEFHNRIGEWAKQQPRKGIWERSSRFYMPDLHGTWDNFTEMVEEQTVMNGEKPVWGPPEFENSGMIASPLSSKPPTTYIKDNYSWGVGEDADFIVFNPIFDPTKTNWVFREDISGYDRQYPVPPRRAAIITVARLSKKLLDLMHEETYRLKHTAFPEMWPPTCAYHHGLKAAYAPHPVYFDRNWPLEYMDQIFNHPKKEHESVFGWGEHNFMGSSYYYNSGFSGALWRRWLGESENKEGGRAEEMAGSGRMCLRSTLLHPIKFENGPTE
ncbi:hypothetical protein H2201_006253 [Coniosporium apollinis]|uniref:Major facilitator superfamily transporter n=2 Tax=Coniosporium TaxID=2810619 RepID=A0ABQ9NMT6_9PEZI|nr:hypothetical protein H2199_007949 [Cladosporium sp. JES 115]KAJ9662145.1 hypothetical protein H2201_006253 [Coniosporium apollinis]